MVFLTILALFLGILYGLSDFEISFLSLISSNSDFILYVLMFSVGISIGLHEGLLAKLRQYHIKVLIIPFGIIIASLLGGIVCAFIIHYPINISTAITSGLGWYSLAGATLGKMAGAEVGSIAFLSNLMREIFSFFIIPFIAVKFNNYTCIAPAAATSEDTTLSMLIKFTNEETVVLAVLNGIICSAFVPILISFCYSLNLF